MYSTKTNYSDEIANILGKKKKKKNCLFGLHHRVAFGVIVQFFLQNILFRFNNFGN